MSVAYKIILWYTDDKRFRNNRVNLYRRKYTYLRRPNRCQCSSEKLNKNIKIKSTRFYQRRLNLVDHVLCSFANQFWSEDRLCANLYSR